MAIHPGPGVVIENIDEKRLYYTYLQFHKACRLADELQKVIDAGEKLDGEAVIVALGRTQMELISTPFNKKASVRFLKPGEI